MRTPIQIMTSVSAAVSAFILPLALATIVPDLPAGPTIEPMFEELEVLLASWAALLLNPALDQALVCLPSPVCLPSLLSQYLY